MKKETYFGIERDALREIAKEKIASAKEENIEFIKYHSVDLRGIIHDETLTIEDLKNLGETSTDGSSLFAKIITATESDMMLIPDFRTFKKLPWLPNTARVLCNIFHPRKKDGETMQPFNGCSRNVLAKIEKSMQPVIEKLFPALEISKFHAHFSPELEFIVLDKEKYERNLEKGKSIHADTTLNNNNYFVPPSHAMDLFLQEVTQCLKVMGLKREKYHTEVATYQCEIGIGYGNVSSIADACITAKYILQKVAEKHGLIVSFIPKFNAGVNGSGMHVHQSLAISVNGKEINMFFDIGQQYGLSKIGQHYIAGLLKFAEEITAITNCLPVSYKRLVPEKEAPTFISWDAQNRTTLCRLHSPEIEKSIRVEYRGADPMCNPYLAFAAMLAAGLEGIRMKLRLPPAEKRDYYVDHDGVKQLPANFGIALEMMNRSRMLRVNLGNDLVNMLYLSGGNEWSSYGQEITDVDIRRYF